MQQQVLTDAERAEGTITKSRWMTLRDSISSTQSLGFRVDAVVTATSHRTAFESELFMTKSEADVKSTLFSFLPSRDDCVGCAPREMARALCRRLAALDDALRASELFPMHEFIGSSLFFAADAHGQTVRRRPSLPPPPPPHTPHPSSQSRCETHRRPPCGCVARAERGLSRRLARRVRASG